MNYPPQQCNWMHFANWLTLLQPRPLSVTRSCLQDRVHHLRISLLLSLCDHTWMHMYTISPTHSNKHTCTQYFGLFREKGRHFKSPLQFAPGAPLWKQTGVTVCRWEASERGEATTRTLHDWHFYTCKYCNSHWFYRPLNFPRCSDISSSSRSRMSNIFSRTHAVGF